MTFSINFRTATASGTLLLTQCNFDDLRSAKIDAGDLLAKRFGHNIRLGEVRKSRKNKTFVPFTAKVAGWEKTFENVFVKWS